MTTTERLVREARAALARRHGSEVRGLTKQHLHTIIETVLAGYRDERQVQRLISEAVQDALARERAKHASEMGAKDLKHANSLLDVDERVENARLAAFEAGKQRMRVKHAQLSEAADDLREAREIVTRALSWTGPPEWRDLVLQRLDAAIRKYQP